MDVRPATVTCPTPSKSKFATREAAENAAHRAQIAMGKRLRPYECVPECGWHHLTSKATDAASLPAPRSDAVAALLALPDAEFRALVYAEIAGRAGLTEAAALRSGALAERWETELKQLEISLMSQLQQRRGEPGPEADAWRSRVTRKRGWVSARRAEARALLRDAVAARQEAQQRAAVERRQAAEEERRKAVEEERRANPGAVAGEAAIHRLIESHQAEFNELLAEEYARLGVELPPRIARRLEQQRAADVQRKQSA